MNKTFKAAALAAAIFCAVAGMQAHAADTALIQARQKFFGADNVDTASGELSTNKVVFSWLSNSSYAVSLAGRLVLFDTGVARLETAAGRTPFVVQDIVDLKPEAIFIGHGHSDAADNAAYIAARTGATVYTTPETCDLLKADYQRQKSDPVIQGNAATRFPDKAFNCVAVSTRGSAPATERMRIAALDAVACINVVKHLHSTPVPADTDLARNTVPIAIDPRDAELFPVGVNIKPAGPALSGQMNITTGGSAMAEASSSLLYHVTMRGGTKFAFAWHDTTGPIKEGIGQGWLGGRGDGLRLQNLLGKLPAVDLNLGAVPSENIADNGMRDLVMYQQAMRPLIFIPNHQTSDPGSPESSSVPLFASYLKQLALMAISRDDWADIRWTTDPSHYAKPIAFYMDNPQWARPEKAASVESLCAPLPPEVPGVVTPPVVTVTDGAGGGSMGMLEAGGLIVLALLSFILMRRRRV